MSFPTEAARGFTVRNSSLCGAGVAGAAAPDFFEAAKELDLIARELDQTEARLSDLERLSPGYRFYAVALRQQIDAALRLALAGRDAICEDEHLDARAVSAAAARELYGPSVGEKYCEPLEAK